MKQVKSDIESFARIRVIGVGGSGNNAVNHMINSKVSGVDFITVNTDAQALHHSLAKKKIHIGKTLTRGLGTGMNPELGRRSAEETKDEIQEAVQGSDMIFVTCGMGGGTGTGAAPVVAQIARESGALTIGVATRPFTFEGQQRNDIAIEGLDELRNEVDALVIVPNDRILAVASKDTGIKNAFAMCDDVLKQAVEGISDLITTPGIINVDFADIRAIMESAGSALMGIGTASGENRATEAAKMAINSPLLDVSIDGATGVLFAVAGGDDLSMLEIQEAANAITESTDANAKIIFGAIDNPKLKKGEISVTVIATGFPNEDGETFSLPQTKKDSTDEEIEEPTTEEKKEVKEEKTEGKIYNSITEEEKIPKKKRIRIEKEEKKEPRKEKQKKKEKKKDDDDNDDWSAIPSFLRRR